MQSVWKRSALVRVPGFPEPSVHTNPGASLTAGSEAAGLRQGLKTCISRQLRADVRSLVHGPHVEEQQWGAKASVLFVSSVSHSDAQKLSGKRLNLLRGQTDLGYNPDPNTS